MHTSRSIACVVGELQQVGCKLGSTVHWLWTTALGCSYNPTMGWATKPLCDGQTCQRHPSMMAMHQVVLSICMSSMVLLVLSRSSLIKCLPAFCSQTQALGKCGVSSIDFASVLMPWFGLEQRPQNGWTPRQWSGFSRNTLMQVSIRPTRSWEVCSSWVRPFPSTCYKLSHGW